jgi:hypothetical protein
VAANYEVWKAGLKKGCEKWFGTNQDLGNLIIVEGFTPRLRLETTADWERGWMDLKVGKQEK